MPFIEEGIMVADKRGLNNCFVLDVKPKGSLGGGNGFPNYLSSLVEEMLFYYE